MDTLALAAAVSLAARFRRDREHDDADAPKTTAGSLGDDATGWLRSLFPSFSRSKPVPRRRDGVFVAVGGVHPPAYV